VLGLSFLTVVSVSDDALPQEEIYRAVPTPEPPYADVIGCDCRVKAGVGAKEYATEAAVAIVTVKVELENFILEYAVSIRAYVQVNTLSDKPSSCVDEVLR
jgi:hypothetical protein